MYGPNGPRQCQLVAGERRARAVTLLGWATIPASVRELSDQQARAITLIENTHREDVDPIDAANGYQAYMDEFGVDAAAVAQAANVPTLFELMTVLDANRQALALTVLASRSRPPTLAEWRRTPTVKDRRQWLANQMAAHTFQRSARNAAWPPRFCRP